MLNSRTAYISLYFFFPHPHIGITVNLLKNLLHEPARKIEVLQSIIFQTGG